MIAARLPAFTTPKLEIEITESRRMQKMESQLKQVCQEKAILETRVTELTEKYGFESYLNNELLDVIRENNIPVRPGLLKSF